MRSRFAALHDSLQNCRRMACGTGLRRGLHPQPKDSPVKAFRKSSLLLAGAVLCAASVTVMAAPPAGKGKRDLADFVRGKPNTKAPRIELPKTEAEAIAERRITSSGMLEIALPEDRMVNLVQVKRADGSVVFVHQAEGATHDHDHDAPKGEVE